MGVQIAFQQMIILFFGILVGFAAVKAKLLDQNGSKVITTLVMNIILPCYIVSSGLTSSQIITGTEMLIYFGLSLVCYLVAYIIGTLISYLPIVPKGEKRIYRFMTTFGNTGFIGLPVIGALFGSDAVFYATIFNLPFNFLVFSVGILLVSDDADVKNVNPKMFFNSCLVASVLAILIYLSGIQLPEIVSSCLNEMGQATVPLAMIITGASLGRESARNIFADASLYMVTIAKTLVVPALTYLVLSVFIANPVMVQVGTVLMAMPVATNATLLCLQYGGPDRTASRGVFLSTLLSVITIPLFVLVLG